MMMCSILNVVIKVEIVSYFFTFLNSIKMKKNQTPLLMITLSLMFFCQTAFIISPKSEANISTTAISRSAPPQYQSEKMPYFKQLMLKIMDKKLNKEKKENNSNQSANSSVILGAASLLSNIGIVLLWNTSSTALLLLGLLLPTLLGLLAILISIMVISNISATHLQKKRARLGILLGTLGLITGVALFLFALYSVAAS
jgi:hypothetical protein